MAIETFEGLPIVDTGGRSLIAKKISFPNDGADFGNSGDQLRSLGDGGVEWAAPGMPTYEQTEQAISDWLNEHPEATTTVQDDSITDAKLNDTLKDDIVFEDELQAEIEKLSEKSYIDQIGDNMFFKCVSRIPIGSNGGIGNNLSPFYGKTGAQGACIFEINDVEYLALATRPDNANTLIIQNLESYEVISDEVFDLGHGNNLSYDGDSTILCYNEASQIVFIDVSAPYNPSVLKIVNTPENEQILTACYVGDTKKVALIHGQLSGYNFNATHASIYTDDTLQTLDKTIYFSGYDSNIYRGFQGVFCDGNYFYITHSYPETIVFINYETGEYVKSLNIAHRYGHVNVTELEAFFKFGDDFYFLAQESLKYSNLYGVSVGAPVSMASLCKCTFKTNESVRQQYTVSQISTGDTPANAFIYNIRGKNLAEIMQYLINPARYTTSDSIGYFFFIDDVITLYDWLGITAYPAISYREDNYYGANLCGLNLTISTVSNVTLYQGLYFRQCMISFIAGSGTVIHPMLRSNTTQGYGITLIGSFASLNVAGVTFESDGLTTYKKIQFNRGMYQTTAQLASADISLASNAFVYPTPS